MTTRGRRTAQRVLALALGVAAIAAGARDHPVDAPPELSATQIVTRNAAARGGLEAWRGVRTMVWTGHLESAHAPMPSMPFILEQKRPNKTRFELDAVREKTLRVFDGLQGWKVHSGRDGRPETLAFTPVELGFAQHAQGLDGPLIDAELKGNRVALEGTDMMAGGAAYRLLVQLPSGERDRVWVDARTFLDLRVDRMPASAGTPVSVFYRDYKTVDGLQIPTTIETGNGAAQTPDRLVIERISLNPNLDDRLFGRPDLQARGPRQPGLGVDGTADRMRRPVSAPAPNASAPGDDASAR